MTRVLVAIPWRAQPHREYAHEITIARYRDLLPDADVIDVDTPHDPFCLAACRNCGVKIAENSGYDVVVLADADTLPEAGPLREAIDAAATEARVRLPYSEYRSLRHDGTAQFLAGVPLADCNHLVVPAACSGVLITTPATWWSCGGQEERMLGWAPEDVAFLIAHRTLLGTEMARHEGAVYSLHHDSPTKSGPAYDAAVTLFNRYLEAAGNPDAIRALITERETAPTEVNAAAQTLP